MRGDHESYMHFYFSVFLLTSISAYKANAEPRIIYPKAQTLTLILNQTQSQSKGKGKGLSRWKKLCGDLSQILLNNRHFSGAFKVARCAYQKPLPIVGRDGHWIASLVQDKNSLAVNLYYQINKDKIKIAGASLSCGPDLLNDLNHSESLKHDLAGIISESLPLGFSFSYQGEDTAFQWPGSRGPQDQPTSVVDDSFKPPKNLTVYQLALDPEKKLWQVSLMASLKPDLAANRAGWYTMRSTWQPLIKGNAYWIKAIDENARALRIKAYQSDIERTFNIDRLPMQLLHSLSSSFMALRYGKSLLNGQSVVTQTSMISILARLRTGPLSDLRFHYDKIPKETLLSPGSKEHFAMTRASLGWSFNLSLPSSIDWLATSIDMQPILGLFDVDYAALETTAKANNSTSVFAGKNALDLGIEIALERISKWTYYRFWGSYHSTKVGAAHSKGVSVSSAKGGTDLTFNVNPDAKVKFGILVFALAEEITLQRDQKAAKKNELLSIYFNMFFAGIGGALTW